jgi:putative protease
MDPRLKRSLRCLQWRWYYSMAHMADPVRSPQIPSSPAQSQFQRPELLAPAGNWDCAKAAVENGADAIYFGLDRFNARMRADNFTEADLPELMSWLHRRGVKGYVTLNTLVFTAELSAAEQYLHTMIAAGVDAAIVQDVGICRLIRQLSPDFPIHASTQMTITSAAGVAFAKELGCQLVVLARECSLKDIRKIQAQLADQQLSLPLEAFVHGALCVAYSGQCLTSESLGGRSANRGECAQACRMPYELICDGEMVDLGDRQYLLSPQDLSGLPVLPDLVQAGIHCLKIEGRLKAPEYVANVTRVYRQALDQTLSSLPPSAAPPPPSSLLPSPSQKVATASTPLTPHPSPLTPQEAHYQLEMAFSRGLHTGWFEGIDNQQLVHARFGKKRGVFLGTVSKVLAKGDRCGVLVRLQAPVKPGDGLVFDNSHPAAREEGGRVYQVESQGQETLLRFGHRDVNLKRVQVGDRLWKTSDPALEKEIQQTYSGDRPQFQRPMAVEVHGSVGQPLVAIARSLTTGYRPSGAIAQATSAMPLEAAQRQPLTPDRLHQQLGRLGNTPFYLASLDYRLEGEVMLPVSELNRLRRQLVEKLELLQAQTPRWTLVEETGGRGDREARGASFGSEQGVGALPGTEAELVVLVRSWEQLRAAVAVGVKTLYCELENPASYRQVVEWFRQHRLSAEQTIWVAPPRITKPLENYVLEQVQRSLADGYLVRNYDQLAYFASDRCVGDFSLNVANPLTADYFKQRYGLERLTASYDLNGDQLEDLLHSAPPQWFEITLHQHMPMFHMEHCMFCAFLSKGKDFRDCGRPCEQHQVKLRDRVGTDHVLMADAGCRNTVFNGVAQTGAEYCQRLLAAGARYFRLEFLQETPEELTRTVNHYRQLLAGELSGAELWRKLQLQSQLGVTRGSLDARSSRP